MIRGHGAKRVALFVAILNVYAVLTGCAGLGGLGGGCNEEGRG